MQKETNGAKVPRHFTFKEKIAALGPGFLICGSFIGPGTVALQELAPVTAMNYYGA